MKKLLKTSLIALLTVLFIGCEKEGHGDFSLSVKKAGPDYVEVFVTAPHAMEIAYVISEEPQLWTEMMLFKKGEKVTVNPGGVVKLGSQLTENKKHYLYAVGRLNDDDFTEIITLEFTTKSFGFDSMLTLMETYYTGFKMHLNYPAETKKRGNAISYGYGCRAMYNLRLYQSRDGIEELVELNSVVDGSVASSQYYFQDTTIVVNEYNEVVVDENGKPVLDENKDYITIHDPYTPGEPLILLAGETRYGTPEEFSQVMGFSKPSWDNWSIPMFDMETMQWTGAFDRIEFSTKEPELCDATLDISFPEEYHGINDFHVRFTPKGEYYQYAYMVLNQSTYDEIMDAFLEDDETLWQWFVPSWIAVNYFTVEYASEPVEVSVTSKFFVEPLNGGETYIILATLLGDEEGLTQRFYKTEFTTRERTKPAPVIEVTALENPGPYYAGFNIKAGKDSNGDVQEIEGAYWACELSREWQKYLNAEYPFSEIIKLSNMTFDEEQLEEINSEAGLDLYFPMLDGEILRFAAYGCNDEYAFNLIDEEENTAGWADFYAPMVDAEKAEVSSEYFTSLLGDWTATATLSMTVEEDGKQETVTMKDYKSKVTISDAAPVLPETLGQEVYDIYKGETPESVNSMFSELQTLNDAFTDYRIKGQNRLLCTGFFDMDPVRNVLSPVGRLDYRSPYTLFTAKDYSSIDVPQLIYDFGPKWFLEVLEDGRVIVPFSEYTIPPLTAWPGYPFYVGGAHATEASAFSESTKDIPGFPVEISADGNTITIKPIVIESDYGTLSAGNYYMNALGVPPMSAEYEIVAKVVTEIKLTKGWYGTEKSQVHSVRPMSASAVSLDGSAVTGHPEAKVVKSLTKLPQEPAPLVKYRQVENQNVVTLDMVRDSYDELLKINYMRYGTIE